MNIEKNKKIYEIFKVFPYQKLKKKNYYCIGAWILGNS